METGGEPVKLEPSARVALPDCQAGMTLYASGMTKKLAVSVPDDVAERLSREANVSAYVTDAVRRRMAGEKTLEMLRTLGIDLSPDKMAEVRARYEALMAGITPELRAEAAALYARVKSGRP